MIQLELNDIHFMLSKLELNDKLRNMLNDLISSENKKITDSDADELRDLCTEYLDVYGFDENYDATPDGEVSEVLIDKLFTG